MSTSGFTLSDGDFHNSNDKWIYSDSNPNPYHVEIVPYSSKVQLQLLADGNVIWSRDASQIIANPWARYTVDTSAYTAGKSTVDVTFRMYIAQDINSLPVIIRLDNLAVEGLTMHNLSFEDTTAWTSTFTEQNVVPGYGGPRRGVRVFNIIREFFTRITDIPITGVARGNKDVNIDFDIISPNGKGYKVYISETGKAYDFVEYKNVNYNSKGAHIKKLDNGKTYYVFVEYSDGSRMMRSGIVTVAPGRT